ncbi:hypothetical protein [Methanosarcina lacustris]|uniref:hypothetical protein n=1 Tax=Methanosarcina lacustris TaxID=170861 RepID=UPI00065003E0|nr:hypothetical protein [Methanosarcina lacustris]
MKLLSTITVRVAFLNLAAFPGFLVLTDDNSKVKTSKYSGVHLNKINFNDDSFKEYSPDSLNPGNEISSPAICVEPGIYRYKITLKSNFTVEQELRADYANKPGSSEKLHINLIDHPDIQWQQELDLPVGV